jgi:GntR family transcriptional repressor for pyruvate dehydrogenase complex
MAAILDEVPTVGGDRDLLAQNDVNFHAALARATHNELFSLLLDSIADIMFTVRQLGFSVPGMPDRTLRYHQAIFEQVKAGNPGQARQAMTEHLVEAEETMRRALTHQAASTGSDGSQ